MKIKFQLYIFCLNLALFISSGVYGGNLFPVAQRDVVYLNQGWTSEQRAQYYWGSQGSAILSYDIYLALELADSNELLNSPSFADRMGFLLEKPNSKYNPDNLPVGVAKAIVENGPFKGTYAGLTCAACHTGQIQYKGNEIRIDGGVPNRLTIIPWIRALSAALDETIKHEDKFQEMLARIKSRGPIDESDLRKRLKSDADHVRKIVQFELGVPFQPGPGRMDALNGINNALTTLAPNLPENHLLSDAPVKAPFLWNAPHSAWVQWSGVGENPLRRNYSESSGVFARYDLTSADARNGKIETTVDVKGIAHLEELLRKLAPPQWPERILGKLNQAKARQGAKLFDRYCVECHTSYPYRWSKPRLEGKRMIENAMVPLEVVGTDSAQLKNPAFNTNPTIATGQLAGLFGEKKYVNAGEFYSLLDTMIKQSIDKAGPFTRDEKMSMNGYLSVEYQTNGMGAPLNSYKAAPRDGTWAIGPFLHNGSIPNLYELLSPASERSKSFYIGRGFDPTLVGVENKNSKGAFLFDTTLPGNSNRGHSFQAGSGEGIIGPNLTKAQKFALIEYLKSIPNTPGRVTPYGGPLNPKIASEDPIWFNTKHPYSKYQ